MLVCPYLYAFAVCVCVDEEDNGNPEVRTLATTANGKGDASRATIVRSNYHNTPVSGEPRPDSELAGLRQADEGHVSPTAGGQMRESSTPMASYAHVNRSGAQAVLSSSLVRWNRLSSPHNSSTEDQPVSTQEGAAPQEHQETSDQMMHTHTSLHRHITQPPYAYTPLHMHTHKPAFAFTCIYT